MKRGIDVSSHQKKIDWKKVSAQIDFCMIRIGYRGYTTGKLSKDAQFENNLAGVELYNVPHGFYIYNACISEIEAIEEANFVIEQLHGKKANMPICFDFEGFTDTTKRVYSTTKESRTRFQNVFNEIIEANGYRVMTYGSQSLLPSKYNLAETTMPIWCARYAGGYDSIIDNLKYKPTLIGQNNRIAMWQYTSVGKIDGISGNVDVNLLLDESILKVETGGEIKVGVTKFTKGKDDSARISKNFLAKEFKCPCKRCSTYLVDVDFVSTVIQKVRDWAGSSVKINSGYRCKPHNTEVGGSPTSNHMDGVAFDINVSGKTPLQVAQFLESIGAKGIIKYSTFVHVDNIPNKRYKVNNNGVFTSVDTFIISKNPYSVPRYTLYKGRKLQSKTYVKWLQFELGITIDGGFGNETERVLKEHQKAHGLEPDGKCGPITIKTLKEEN